MTNQREPTGDEDLAEIVGRNIKTERQKQGLSQVALADYMVSRGFSAWRQTTVSRTERGERELLASEMSELEAIFSDLWRGTKTGALMGDMARYAYAKKIEASMARIGTELQELGELWDKYQRAQAKDRDRG